MTIPARPAQPFRADCTISSLRLLRPLPRWKPALRPSPAALETAEQPDSTAILVAEEVTEARAIAGQGLVGDALFGLESTPLEPWGGCVLFSSMESWTALAKRLSSLDVESPSNTYLPRHVLTQGVEWALVDQPFQIGEVVFRPLEQALATKVLGHLDRQLRLPHWEAWGIFPGIVATVEQTGWLRSERPVFCGCGS